MAQHQERAGLQRVRPLKTASGVGRGRALAAVGNGSRGVAGPGCSGTDFAAVAVSMPAFVSDFLSASFADLEAFGRAELALELAAPALPPLDLVVVLREPLAEPLLAAVLAVPDLEAVAALVSAPPLLAVAAPRVPAEELLAEPLLAVLALEVLGLAVLALEVLALAVEDLLAVLPRPAGLLALAVLVPVDLVPVDPLARDPDDARVPVERAVAPDAGRLARVPLDAGAALAADVVALVAVDIALVASVSDFTADSIALVAVLIDCRAVVIVRADV